MLLLHSRNVFAMNTNGRDVKNIIIRGMGSVKRRAEINDMTKYTDLALGSRLCIIVFFFLNLKPSNMLSIFSALKSSLVFQLTLQDR